MVTKTQLERVKLLREKWKEVDPARVDLDSWTCGTHACLAGHAMQMPEFIEQGFEADCKGRPSCDGSTGLTACEYFFGEEEIFRVKGGCEFDYGLPGNISDYYLALHRLNRFIETHEGETEDE